MCKSIDVDSVMPGWGCCKCHTYNSIKRTECKYCGYTICGINVEEIERIDKKHDAIMETIPLSPTYKPKSRR